MPEGSTEAQEKKIEAGAPEYGKQNKRNRACGLNFGEVIQEFGLISFAGWDIPIRRMTAARR